MLSPKREHSAAHLPLKEAFKRRCAAQGLIPACIRCVVESSEDEEVATLPGKNAEQAVCFSTKAVSVPAVVTLRSEFHLRRCRVHSRAERTSTGVRDGRS